MSRHPIQLNFSRWINSPILSDIKLESTVRRKTKVDEDGIDQKCNETDTAQLSLDDDEGDSNEVGSVIHAHWDLLRARSITFDLIFHAMLARKAHLVPLDGVSIDSDTIRFDICYDALVVVVKYLYSGVLRRYDYDDIAIARDVLRLAEILRLNGVAVDVGGQYLCSRKRLKESQIAANNSSEDADDHKMGGRHDDGDDGDEWADWKALGLHSFDFSDWSAQSDYGCDHFLNLNVLYSEVPYSEVPSRQRVRVGHRHFQISKIVFVAVSQYFKVMFCGSNWKESLQPPSQILEIKGIDPADFERLQMFLYSFDQNTFRCDEVRDVVSAWNLSIYFGVEDLRQCLLILIDRHYLRKETLLLFWSLGFELEAKDLSALCSAFFAKEFSSICSDEKLFRSLTKRMIRDGLATGSIAVGTEQLVRVLAAYCTFHATSIQELLPPHTLFNEANKLYMLQNRGPIDGIHHLLRM